MKVEEDIIEAEFFVVDEDGADSVHEARMWVLVGDSLQSAKLAKVFLERTTVASIATFPRSKEFRFPMRSNYDFLNFCMKHLLLRNKKKW